MENNNEEFIKILDETRDMFMQFARVSSELFTRYIKLKNNFYNNNISFETYINLLYESRSVITNEMDTMNSILLITRENELFEPMGNIIIDFKKGYNELLREISDELEYLHAD